MTVGMIYHILTMNLLSLDHTQLYLLKKEVSGIRNSNQNGFSAFNGNCLTENIIPEYTHI